MPILFFDTSALVRRYDSGEPQSRRVRAFCRQGIGNALVMTRLVPIEIASAFNRKVRLGQLDEIQRSRLWTLFRRHLREQYRVMSPDEQLFQEAERLLFSHPLRAFDAVHLAGALRQMQLTGLAGDLRFCTADQAQARAAAAEGLTVELIS